MLTTSIVLILVVVAFLLTSLYLEWFKPTVSFFIAILALVVSGVISPAEALQGFANEQLAVIIVLLMISDMFRRSSVVNVVFKFIFGKQTKLKSFQLMMMSSVAAFSAFFNNTPLVAMMMPYVNQWSKDNKVAPSKLLMPLSFAAILGGCITLIGTSTNLIVNGLAVDAGFESLSIFDFTAVGLPMLVIGMLYLLLFGDRLLPNRKESESQEVSEKEFFVEAIIKGNSKLINKSVENAGFRKLDGLYLVEVVRDANQISPIGPDFILEENDHLIFAGETASVEGIRNSNLGLTLPKVVDRMMAEKASVNEIVISYNSSLIGKQVNETDFRARYDAAIVAIHRNGERLSGKIGNMQLESGDVLFVFSGNDFLSRAKNNKAFYILSHIEEPEELGVKKVAIVFLALIGSIILSAASTISLLLCLSVTFLIGILLKVMPLNDIRKGLDFDLIVLISFGLALGKAMINSGASIYLADLILTVNQFLNPVFLLMFIFLTTNILSAYITNKAAVAILFPISVALALELGFSATPFILIVSFGAAANFITPIGYQTNLMVYGPGGYAFKDFMKVGLPLTLIYMVVSAVILAQIYEL